MIDRRGFFKTLFAGAAVAVLPKPEILIHRIADPIPFFPPLGPWAPWSAVKQSGHLFYFNRNALTMVWPDNYQRTIRIVGPDGTEKRVEINAPASLS